MARNQKQVRSRRIAAARGGSLARMGAGERGVSEEPEHAASPTAVAAEALRTGVLSGALARGSDEEEIPGESEKIRAGDPDDATLGNEYVGEETPGGSTPTPDQSNVDDIGRAYGVQEEDSGELRTSSEILERRDHRLKGVGVGRRHS
jgi:hypothetical protein